jgi:hypothetical protein
MRDACMVNGTLSDAQTVKLDEPVEVGSTRVCRSPLPLGHPVTIKL